MSSNFRDLDYVGENAHDLFTVPTPYQYWSSPYTMPPSPGNNNNHRTRSRPRRRRHVYRTGDSVVAEWEDGKEYPATITRVRSQTLVDLRFSDGLSSNVRCDLEKSG